MPTRVLAYVWSIVATAIAFTALVVVASGPVPPSNWLVATICMASLAVISQLLAHAIGQTTTGSISSIPYLAGIVLVPNWRFVLAVLLVEILSAVQRRRPFIKSLFNVAQGVLACAAATLVYLALGGISLMTSSALRAVAYFCAVATFFAVNSLSVSGVVAISESRRLPSVWRQVTRGALLYDVLASPIPYAFAAVFASKGILGAILLAIPLLAVRQVFRTSWQLEQATQDLLQLMVKAIEARDPYTSGHSQRVQEYSQMIGRAIGLSNRKCERLATAALLHDVGKIHEIYAPILRKPDKLTSEEWAIMKTHPIKSAELVDTVSQLKDLVLPVRHHHENWDGTGYPDQLAGEAIPLWARIITIADTIDAMTTDRPYRKALTVDLVRIELASMAGRQFDPNMCVALLQGNFFESLNAKLGGGVRHAIALSIESGRPRQRIQGI